MPYFLGKNVPDTFNSNKGLTYISLYHLIKLDKFIKIYKETTHRKKADIEKLLKNKNRHIKKTLSEGLIKKIVWRFTRSIYDKCDLISVPSKAIKRELINHGFKKPIRVISNGIPLNKFVPKKRPSRKNIKLLHVNPASFTSVTIIPPSRYKGFLAATSEEASFPLPD